jgi:plasmid stabilization system protein ParE
VTHLILVKPQAEADIAEAFRWYEQQRSGLGQRFLAAVDAAIAGIAENPRRYAAVHSEVRRGPVRGFPYSLYFREEANRVVILTVAHQRRDPKVWRKRT